MNISTRLVLAGLLVAIAAAEPSSAETFELGPPLLQVTAQGVEVTDILLPFCGVSCHATDPTFVTHQVTIGIDGAVAAVRTRNRLEDDDPALTEVVAGQGRAATYRQLRQALVAARIGVAEGGCRLGLSRSVTSGSTNGVTISSFDVQLTWFGGGNRRHRINFRADTDTLCPAELNQVVTLALRYGEEAAAAP